ncbi:unnamed protein product [Macrosiphum euphorbiae]|uniref:Reverse transcriptase n=1 Tax=Macrosiphum euphorbiae TaxID=13131 RepID=A0AAV0VLM7_9HEMI|nr:unnamed protein product [Macrosiphum euphorbiae]
MGVLPPLPRSESDQPRLIADGPSSHSGALIPGWSVRKLNPALLNIYWDLVGAPLALPVNASAETHADRPCEFLTKSCDATMPRRAVFTGKRSAYWWNNEIAELHKVATAARRTYQRAGRRSSTSPREQERATYQRARLDLKHAIKKSQADSWRQLCLSVENDPWGVPYKLVSKRLGSRAPDLSHDLVVSVAQGLFPLSPHTDWARIPNVSQQPTVILDLPLRLDNGHLAPPITAQEISTAVARLPSGKAPGPDQVPNEAIRVAYNQVHLLHGGCWIHPKHNIRCFF